MGLRGRVAKKKKREREINERQPIAVVYSVFKKTTTKTRRMSGT